MSAAQPQPREHRPTPRPAQRCLPACLTQVARRYSHFRSNHNALVGMFSGHRLPRLPPKQLLPAAASAAATASLVAERLVMLDAYLKQMLAVPDVYVGGCTQMLTFLGAYQGMQTSWFAQPNWRACSIDGGGDDDEGGAAAAADSTWELAALHGGGEAAARQAPTSASLLLQAQVLVDGLGLQVRSAFLPSASRAVSRNPSKFGRAGDAGSGMACTYPMHARPLCCRRRSSTRTRPTSVSSASVRAARCAQRPR